MSKGIKYIIAASCMTVLLSAQPLNHFNQSGYQLILANPAYAGEKNKTHAGFNYRKSWMMLPGSPEHTAITLSGAIPSKKLGLGLIMQKESAGIFEASGLSIALRYSLRVTALSHIDFGLAGGYQTLNSHFGAIKAERPEEFSDWPSMQRSTTTNASAGLIYRWKGLHAGLAFHNISASRFYFQDPVKSENISLSTQPHLNISLKNDFESTNRRWVYTPVLQITSIQGHVFRPDLLNTVSYDQQLLLGVGYRHNTSVYLTGGILVAQSIRMIYSFERSLFSNGMNGGSHEIGLTITLNERIAGKPVAEPQHNDEIYEKLEYQEEMLERIKIRADSADRHINRLRTDMEDQRNKQVSDDEISQALDEMNRVSAIKHHKLKEKDLNENTPQNTSLYQVVLGVYQLPANAREYQKFLLRTLQMETELVQISGQSKKYIYVCKKRTFSDTKEALSDLNSTLKLLRTYSTTITKGEPWILQTVKK